MALVPFEGPEEESSLVPVDTGKKGSDGDEFTLPFKVATLVDLEQRAYINDNNKAEWLFGRVHKQAAISKDPGRLLRENKRSLEQACAELQVPFGEEIYYRGVEDRQQDIPWKDHTLGSAGLLVFLLWVVKNKGLTQQAKVKALELFLAFATKAFEYAFQASAGVLVLTVMLESGDGVLISEELRFNEQSLCSENWKGLLECNPAAFALWSRLGARCWMNRCIGSRVVQATYQDILFFFMYMWCHPKLRLAGYCVWNVFGAHTLPLVVSQLGQWINQLALSLGGATLKELPVLKSKTGRATKIADPINKLLLLWKLRKEKLHRQRIAKTHEQFGEASQPMVRVEHYLDCLLYLHKLEEAFGDLTDCPQISVSWDPSTYGGKDTFVGIVYSCCKNLAAYLPNQQLSQVLFSDLHDSLIPLGRAKKLCRLDGFKDLKGLSASLKGIGLSLNNFRVPVGLICRPLAVDEIKFVGPDGEVYIHNERTGGTYPQIPPHLDIAKIPMLHSVSDQGPNNVASLNFAMFSSHALLFWATWDPYHRAWNDIKLCLKRAQCSAWRVVLEYTLIANINYGPFGQGSWYFKKKAKLEQFLLTSSIDSPLWQRLQHLIANERRMAEPKTREESECLLDSMRFMNTILVKGPLVKLMRWFSWFEAMLHYAGEFYCTKLIILHGEDEGQVEEASEAEIDHRPLNTKERDHQKELQDLKRRKGTWKLTPSLINERSMAIKDSIMAVGRATWKAFAARARSTLSPQDTLDYNISCAATHAWSQELADLIHQSLWDARNLEHLMPKFCMHDKALVWHMDLADKLLETRAMSLTAFYTLPPALYHHKLSLDANVAQQAHKLALEHYAILLEAECEEACGNEVEALAYMYWRKSPLVRCLFLAYEVDELKGLALTPESKASHLQRVLAQNLGDSRVIENAHQHGRDLLRSAKHSLFSNPSIFANTLKSGALEERKVPCPTVQAAEVATAKSWNKKDKESVNSQLKSQNHKLPKDLQQLMVPKTGGNTWPSPSPASLFPSAAATHWLFRSWNAPPGSPLASESINASWLSFVARPGAILAQQSTGSLVKVVASADMGFLGLLVNVEMHAGKEFFVCRSNRMAFDWHFVLNLEDWLEVPVNPCIVRNGGPVGWEKNGHPLPVATSLCLHGASMTFAQAKRLIKHLGGAIPSNPSKRKLQLILIENLVPQELQQFAKDQLPNEKKKEEDGIDTDFSEVLSELDNDEANRQDLKDFKEKKKTRRYKKKAELQEPVEGKKKRQPGKGKKGTGKGKHSKKKKLFSNVVWKGHSRKEGSS